MLADFDDACGKIGLQLNITKTMFMRNGWVPDAPFSLNRTTISECSSYVYLGHHYFFEHSVLSCVKISAATTPLKNVFGTRVCIVEREKCCNQATLSSALGRSSRSSFQTVATPNTIRPFITWLVPFELKRGDRPECVNQSRLATPFFPSRPYTL
ncbi:hypothetical protein Y032_0677g1440 [Ancylostoma ceylanicum]|uniref:Reverse transcriptase domain-containing protein n=1 Tax=Ancylostoma ceylanicum TaxID=53326 RepID=A0A016WIK6_9BILA|nr:hypothetical protein Y032_0677g1440 [Ancylostoma ceylanicum]